MTEEERKKSHSYCIKYAREIWESLENIECALDEYDEECGLAFSDIPDKFDDIKEFFREACGYE